LQAPFEIFLATAPGLEPLLADEARGLGFAEVAEGAGGVTITGGWPEVWRANLHCRGATRVLARIAQFRALHVAQLDKRARRVPWAEVLRPDVPVRVEATTRASRIYHAGAAKARVARAIAEDLGAPIVEGAAEDAVAVRVRLEDDLCTLSVDTSGAPLHRRGFKQAVGKAPLRETMAALFLRACGHDGAEPVLDPMCGSGTFVIEAAEIAAGLAPGRARGFAFEHLARFDAEAWAALRGPPAGPAPGPPRAFGRDRDAGAIRAAQANAERAGVAEATDFARGAISDLERPDGPPGLVMVNPPYGGRIGKRGPLHGLHAALGEVLRARFSGWRVGLVTADPGLARATGLPFGPPGPPVPHGSLKIRLFRAEALP
jgi:putative N6-adenine-specific DNA methylase